MLIEKETGLQVDAVQVSPNRPESVGRVLSFVGVRCPEA